jgi:hypothetical protein
MWEGAILPEVAVFATLADDANFEGGDVGVVGTKADVASGWLVRWMAI